MQDTQLTDLFAAVDRFHRRWRQVRFLQGSATVLAVAILVALAAGVLDFFANLSIFPRYAMAAMFYGTCLCLTLWCVVRPVLRRMTAVDVAWLVERRNPQLNETFVTIVQLVRDEPEHVSQHMIDRLMEQVLESLENVSPRKTFPLTLAEGGWKLAVLALGALWVLVPGAKGDELLARLVWPSESQASVGTFDLKCQPYPGDEVVEGRRVSFTISTDNRALRRVSLYFKYPDGRLRRENIARRDVFENFSFALENVYEDVEYWAQAGKVKTVTRRLSVRKRPKIDRFVIRYRPPAHTDLPAVQFESTSGDLKALVNTNVELAIVASASLSKAEIAVEGEPLAVQLSPDRRTARCRILVDRSGTYTIKLYDASGLTSPEAITHSVTMIPDAAPRVTVFEPRHDLFAASDGLIHFEWSARDDLRVVRQEVHCQIVNGERFVFPVATTVKDFDLELARLRVVEGDELEVTVRAYDATRQEAVSTPIRVVVLDTPGYGGAASFMADLDELIKDIAEAEDRLHQVQASVQDVLLARASNVGKNADLGHQLLMLDHRIERVDKQLLLILKALTPIFENAFFPHSHDALRSVMDALANQVVFGTYHRQTSIAKVKDGCVACRELLVRSRRACELLKRHAGGYVVDVLGDRLMSKTEESGSAASATETAREIHAKMRLFGTILQDDRWGSSEEGVEETSDVVALRKAMVDLLAINERAMRDVSALKEETEKIVASQISYKRSLYGLSGRLTAPDSQSWRSATRFVAVVDATRELFVAQAGDWDVLGRFFNLAKRTRSAAMVETGVDAWERMRNARFSQQLETLTAVSVSQFTKFGHEVALHATADSLDLLNTFPITGWHKDRRGMVKTYHGLIGRLRAVLSPNRTKGSDAQKLLIQLRDASTAIARHDLEWRRLMRKALVKKMPSASDRLHATITKLRNYYRRLDVADIGTLGQLEQISHELTTFALNMEKRAIEDIKKPDADVASLRYSLGVSKTILSLLEEKYPGMTNQYAMLLSLDNDELLVGIESLKRDVADVLTPLDELLDLLKNYEMSDRGMLALAETMESRRRSLQLVERALPDEIRAHLNQVELIGLAVRLAMGHDGELHGNETRANRSPEILQNYHQIAHDTLSLLDRRLSDRWRTVAIDALNTARSELDVLDGMLTGEIPLPDLAEQAQVAYDLLQDSEASFRLHFPRFAGGAEAFREDVLIPVRRDIFSEEGVRAGVGRASRYVDDMSVRVLSLPAKRTPRVGYSRLKEKQALELVKQAEALENTLVKAVLLNDLNQKTRSAVEELTKAGSKLLQKLHDSIPRKSSERKRLSTLRRKLEGMELATQVETFVALGTKFGTNPHATPIKTHLTTLEKARLQLDEPSTLKRQIDDALKGLIHGAVGLQRALSGCTPSLGRLHLEFLLVDFKDNLKLKDYGAATLNLQAFQQSIVQGVTINEYVSDPFEPPSLAPVAEAAEPDDAGLGSNPYVLRALVLIAQEEWMSSDLKQELRAMIRTGQFESAMRFLPGHRSDLLAKARTVERLLPKPDDVPRGYESPGTMIPFGTPPVTEELFDACAYALLFGNRQAAAHALDGDWAAAEASMRRYASAVTDAALAKAANAIGDAFKNTTGSAVSLDGTQPTEATAAAEQLAAVIDDLGPMPIHRLLVIKAEQGRVLQLLAGKNYRQAATVALALSEWFQGKQLQDFWVTFYKLQRLDRELFGKGNPTVRRALASLYPEHDRIRWLALAGNLGKAAELAERSEKPDVARELRDGRGVSLAAMPDALFDASALLEECFEATSDGMGAERLRTAIEALEKGQVDIAWRKVSELLDSMDFPVAAYKHLEDGFKPTEMRVSRMTMANLLLRGHRFREALVVLTNIPDVTDVRELATRAQEALDAGKRDSMKGALALRSVGKKSALRMAFNQAIRYNLDMALARAEAAGSDGKFAAANFKKAQTLAKTASDLLDAKAKQLRETSILDEETRGELASIADDLAQRRALLKQLEGGFNSHAVITLKNLKPVAIKLYRTLEILGSYENTDRMPVAQALTKPLDQHLRYFYRGLSSLYAIQPKDATEDISGPLAYAFWLLRKSMYSAAERGGDLLQGFVVKRSQKRARRPELMDDELTADRKAWIERLEKSMALDGNAKGMALMSNFQIGRKRNYAGYYRAANRSYLNWLANESKTWDGGVETASGGGDEKKR